MSNDAILILEENDEVNDSSQETSPQEFLRIKEALSELADDATAAVARRNIQAITSSQAETIASQVAQDIVDKDRENLRPIIEDIENNLITSIQKVDETYVKKDGSTPFTAIQKGVTPNERSPKHSLVTVEYILEKLQSYLTSEEFRNYAEEQLKTLEQYVEKDSVWPKNKIYNKTQVDNLLEQYVRQDIPTTEHYPRGRNDITNKAYVDNILKQHKENEYDPHGFKAEIKKKLANYYTQNEVWNRSQTYSRDQVDAIIDELVKEACRSLIQKHLNTTQHLTSQDVQRIVKTYSSANLINKDELEEVLLGTEQKINNVDPIWKTSGPVLTTVGFVEDNTELPREMTMQEILDSIFYGAKISVQAPNRVQIGGIVDVMVCIHGGMKTDSVILYQDDEILREFTDGDFTGGCVTVPSKPIVSNTIFRFVVLYTNGLEQEVTTTTEAISPMFVGLLPKWKFGYTVSMEYLKELAAEDPQNNKFITEYQESEDIVQSYNFKDLKLKHILLAIPSDCPDLKEMITSSQRFGLEAFDVIDLIPLRVEIVQKDIVYKLYIYRQALASMNQDVTFKFTSKEQVV